MSVSLDPYLHFATEARDAMAFYQSVFGGDLVVMTFGDMGMEPADLVMHSSLTAPDGVSLMGSDTPPGMDLPQGQRVTLSLSGDDEDRLRGWFEALAEGGEIHMALEKQFWGDLFGQCADRYGVVWLANISPAS